MSVLPFPAIDVYSYLLGSDLRYRRVLEPSLMCQFLIGNWARFELCFLFLSLLLFPFHIVRISIYIMVRYGLVNTPYVSYSSLLIKLHQGTICTKEYITSSEVL